MAVKFDKYETHHAVHWTQTNRLSWCFNAPLVSRYNSVLRHMPREASSVLDIGCGDGRLTCLIAQALRLATVVGIDSEQSGIDIALRKKSALDNVFFQVSRTDELPFDQNSFDVIVVADVIEHLLEPNAMLREIGRVLRTTGTALITTPNRQDGSKWDIRHEFEFRGPELKYTVSEYFATVDVFGSWPMTHVRAWKAKRAGRLVLDLQARFGRNLFDTEVRDPTAAYGQLTAVASVPLRRA